jgi:hypothetical protein
MLTTHGLGGVSGDEVVVGSVGGDLLDLVIGLGGGVLLGVDGTV